MTRDIEQTGRTNFQWPLRMGFFLVELGIMSANWPDIPYGGVDRVVSLDNFQEEFEQNLAGTRDVWSVWEAYWEAENNGVISVDRSTALDFRERFNALGMSVETIYCEIVRPPAISAHDKVSSHQQQRLHDAFTKYEHVQRQLPERPTGLVFLGYDLSFPLPTFHSIIRQPATMNPHVVMPSMLNSYGLISDVDTATELLPRANQDQVSGPICLLGIWSVES